MSFTQDELQALDSIMGQKIDILSRDLERAADRRMSRISHELEQHVISLHQVLLKAFADNQVKMREMFQQFLQIKQRQELSIATLGLERYQKDVQQSFEDFIDRSLAAQLLAFEQLLHQHVTESSSIIESATSYSESLQDFKEIEVQTEIAWDELVDLMDHSLDQRFAALQDSLVSFGQDIERRLTAHIQALHGAVSTGMMDVLPSNTLDKEPATKRITTPLSSSPCRDEE
ncbi:MAG TPA: hypothetical protein VL461_13720 [Dictyobacter sp.]|jgi:hypothetical protein|nr:hypothetical protein [Dictyobacter sp.]